MPQKLPIDFYRRQDVVQIAKELLGKFLISTIDGIETVARITETEAYCGANDNACHAYLNKRTPRTEVMYGSGGNAYVYLCYGIHHLFNVVTNEAEHADAVLIRAAEPISGIDHMLERRGMTTIKKNVTSGPGSMSKALGITIKYDGIDLQGDTIWLEDAPTLEENRIAVSARIGVESAGEAAHFPWRFYDRDSEFVS